MSAVVSLKYNVSGFGNPFADNPNLTPIPKKQKVSLTLTTLAAVRHFTHSIIASIPSVSQLRPLEGLKTVKFVGIPIAISDVVTSVSKLPNTSLNEKADTALSVTADVGFIADATATSAEGLVGMGVIASGSIGWALPVFLLGYGMQFAGLALLAKNFVESQRFSKKFAEVAQLSKDVNAYTVEDFSKGIEVIEKRAKKEKSFIAKHFGSGCENIVERLSAIRTEAEKAIASSVEGTSSKHQTKMKTAMELIGDRLTTRKDWKKLDILAATVAAIGVALLFTPALPVAFAMISTGAILAIVHFAAMRRFNGKFEEAFKKLEKEVSQSNA